MPRLPLRSALLVLALATSCTTDRYLPKHIFTRMQSAYTSDSSTGGISKSVMEQQEARFARVRLAIEKDEIVTAEDHYYSAAILVTSDQLPDLEHAHELAEEANAMGLPAGLRVAAQAIDILALKHGRPQKYGTQFRFEPVLGEWKLHNIDPRTTDEDRIAMGLPTMAELQEILAARNASPMTERLKKRMQVSRKMPE